MPTKLIKYLIKTVFFLSDFAPTTFFLMEKILSSPVCFSSIQHWSHVCAVKYTTGISLRVIINTFSSKICLQTFIQNLVYSFDSYQLCNTREYSRVNITIVAFLFKLHGWYFKAIMKAEVVGWNRCGRWRETNIQVCVALKFHFSHEKILSLQICFSSIQH